MPFDLLFNAMLMDHESSEPVVRYLQVGMIDADGFTGLITDYCGGGEWDDLYVLRDAPLSPGDLGLDDGGDGDDDGDDVDADEYEAHVDDAYPGLLEAIWEWREDLVELADDVGSVYPVAVGELLDLCEGSRAEQVLSNLPGALTPIDGFHTSFADPVTPPEAPTIEADDDADDDEGDDEGDDTDADAT